MKAKMQILCFVVAVLGFTACATLTPGGQNVTYVTKQEAPTGYTFLGEVSLGMLEYGQSYKDTLIRLRNKTAEMGGDFLVVDSIESVQSGNSSYFEGSGRAYKKPEPKPGN